MLAQRVLVPDRWLAARLGRPAFRVAGVPEPDGAVWAELRVPGAFAWARVPVERPADVRALGSRGFTVVDTTVTLERPLAGLEASGEPGPTVTVRDARPDDEPALVALARSAFRCSRFHLDDRIEPARADAIKADWVASWFRGDRGDAMTVAADGHAPVGFLLWRRSEPGVATIDLVAVHESRRGEGIAARLTAAARALVPAPDRLRVGTQIANRAALGCYLAMGFRVRGASYVMHYHSDWHNEWHGDWHGDRHQENPHAGGGGPS